MVFGVACALALSASPALAQTGNGAQSGSHYNLNLIGYVGASTQAAIGKATLLVGEQQNWGKQ